MSSANQKAATPPLWIDAIVDAYARHRQLAKYFLIGGMASAIDLGLFLLLFHVVGTTPLVAHSVSVPTAVVFSFLLNARHNFNVNDYLMVRLLSFCVVCTVGYTAGYAVIELADLAGLGVSFGKVLSLPVVFLLQYQLNSRITFRKSRAITQG